MVFIQPDMYCFQVNRATHKENTNNYILDRSNNYKLLLYQEKNIVHLKVQPATHAFF